MHPRTLVAGAGLAFCLAACQGPEEFHGGFDPGTGQAGSAPTGAAGSIVSGTGGSGAGGSIVSGAAGSIMSGAAGTSAGGAAGSIVSGAAGTSAGGTGGAGGGAGGTTGTAGTTGATGTAGTTGSAGRGGASGTAGSAGRGGASGGAGSGGRGGGAGSAGRGGGGGSAGSGGRGGQGGRGGGAGAMGSGGAGGGGGNTCPAGGRLDCTAAGSLELTPDGQVVDFSAAQWNSTTARFCDAHGLDGGLSSYAGTGSTAAAAVDPTAQNLKLNFMVVAGGYAGGRINFDSCVDASTFNSVQFTASVTAGAMGGCVWQVQLQTQNQRPTTATNPMGGTCNATTTTCERYPAATLAAATATATTMTTRFTAFDNPSASAIATPTQIVGLQWQVNSGNSGSGTCTVELRVDNVRFVTQ